VQCQYRQLQLRLGHAKPCIGALCA
jgi:hypothetical protein